MDFTLGDDEMMLRDSVRQLCQTHVVPHAARWDADEAFPVAAVNQLAELGLLGMDVPEQFDGVELSTVASAVAIEELAAADGSLALTVSSHNSLCVGHIATRGTEEQKRRWLPALASGEALGAWALTEQGAGSDPSGVRTTATPDGDGYRIRGAKTFVSQGSVAGTLVVIASTDPEAGRRGLTAFVVERDTPGLEVVDKVPTLGMRASDTADLRLDVVVPRGNLLGEPGEAFKDALRLLDRGRINVAAMACGIGRGAMQAATAYAKQRKQFDRPIAQFQAIQWKLANMETELSAAWLLTLRAAALRDEGEDHTTSAARAKLFAAQAASRACHEAIQIHGGYGYVREFPVERALRDVRMCQIGEGTNEILKLVVSRDIAARFGG